LFLLKLQCRHHIPSVTVDFIAKEFFSAHQLSLDKSLTLLRTAVAESSLATSRPPTAVDSLCSEIRERDPFKIAFSETDGVLRSAHCRQLYNQKHFRFVPPVQITLGKDKNDKMKHFHYIPVRKTLESMLQDASVSQTIEAHCQSPSNIDPRIYQDICDGEIYQSIKNTVTENCFIELLLFQDAFEIVNPLGSAKKVHKIVAFYLALGNLPCYARTNVDNLQLVLLCREVDLNHFGQDKVLSKLIADLKDLELSGVQIGDTTYRARLMCMLGDNLGSHWVGGFSTNFSNNSYVCRYCLIEKKKNDASSLCKTAELRTPENYNRAVSQVEGSKPSYGVLRKSAFNELEYFDVCMPGLPPCLGHDLFEGLVQYDLALAVRHIMKDNCSCSYEYLNKTVALFKFLGHDSLDKPGAISDSKSIGGHAVQNWCFLRLLPIWLGDVVDTSDEVWQFILLLREIVELVCAPRIAHDQVLYLGRLISLYLEDRLHLFPTVPLRPKHHFLLHYPWLIRKFGPLIRVWTMRMESKHSFFKQCARSCRNYINVTKTLSDTHQSSQMYLSTGVLLCNNPVLGSNYNEFSSKLFSDSVVRAVSFCTQLNGTLHCSEVVTVKGTKYFKGCFVITACHNSIVEFGKVSLCLVDSSDQAALVTARCESYKDPNLGLYVITLCNEYDQQCILIDHLWDYFPLPSYEVRGQPHIALKHAVVSTDLDE